MCNRLWVATILAGLLTWQAAATRADDVVRLPPTGPTTLGRRARCHGRPSARTIRRGHLA